MLQVQKKQQKVLEYKKGNPKALFELIDLTADITTNDKTGELINEKIFGR